jgi:hypothetical protein
MTADFPRPGVAMMAARRAAFHGRARPRPFARKLFRSQVLEVTADDCVGRGRSRLVESIVDNLATHPDGDGIGYCLLSGGSELTAVEATRSLSAAIFAEVWARFRTRSGRFSESRDFFCSETVTYDGEIPTELFRSQWSFKAPHADRNGVLFAHVYGPTVGFDGGEVVLIDALAYAGALGLGFDDVFTWSDDPGAQKPVMLQEHVGPALAGFGRRLGKLGPDNILLVNNAPEGLLHGATELEIADVHEFTRVLHRCVVRERDADREG